MKYDWLSCNSNSNFYMDSYKIYVKLNMAKWTIFCHKNCILILNKWNSRRMMMLFVVDMRYLGGRNDLIRRIRFYVYCFFNYVTTLTLYGNYCHGNVNGSYFSHRVQIRVLKLMNEYDFENSYCTGNNI